MRGIIAVLLIVAAVLVPLPVRAYSISDDPQFIVMNIASVNELDWAADEEIWQKTVKPQITKLVREIKTTLPRGTTSRKLAWSTLMEYMNFPMDTPSDTSVYVIKIRRILEIAEEEDLPVFLPLNGFQWWDELPELYNWWDPDGTQTPQSFFARQKTKDFRERFIRGYNPENRWNVEWSGYETPMKLNVRNWGGGGFRLAPPPNILRHTRSPKTYRDVLEGRFAVLVSELTKTLDRWEREGKSYLFAGISLGTEVSLNASVTARDEFTPYGYRAAQDLLCDTTDPTCGITARWTRDRLRLARLDALQSYLFDLSLITRNHGIPKQRVYTHVYADTYIGNPTFEKYADAAFTPFARPGISLYGSATNPFGLTQWIDAMKKESFPVWGALEYSAGTSFGAWAAGLSRTMDSSVQPAKILVIYNLREHRGTPAMDALAGFLTREPEAPCVLPEIIPGISDRTENPDTITWRYVPDGNRTNISGLWLHVTNEVSSFSVPIQEKIFPLRADATSIDGSSVPFGTHDWYVEAEGCDGKKQYSEPRTLTVRASFSNIFPINWVIRTLRRLQ